VYRFIWRLGETKRERERESMLYITDSNNLTLMKRSVFLFLLIAVRNFLSLSLKFSLSLTILMRLLAKIVTILYEVSFGSMTYQTL